MEGTKRREAILAQLEIAEKPVSASHFAKEFGVSRQIIVGDVALLRASGAEIIATSRGYKLAAAADENRQIAKLAVQHGPEQMETELATIIENGGEVIDIIVEHPLYGEIVGGLYLSTQEDVQRFLTAYRETNAQLLSKLTGGIHLHTISYQSDEDLARIKKSLAEVGILYQP